MTAHLSPEMIELYVDGHLMVSERRRVEVHLAGCGECFAHLDALRAIVDGLDSLAEPTLPEDFAADLTEDVVPGRDMLVAPARSGVLVAVGLCCAALLGICAAMLAFDSPVAGVSDDVPGQIDLLLGSPFQVQAGVLAALAVTAVLGMGLMARVLASTPIPHLGRRR